jgi:murein DD-endopeptidase MepM/ murein hydrolase activator NlpD
VRVRSAAAALAGLAAITAAAGAEPAAGGGGFELGHASVSPRHAFFDAEKPIRVRYRFEAERPLDLVIRVVSRERGKPVRRWTERKAAPLRLHRLAWDGRRAGGGVPADGTYEIRIGPPGHRGSVAGRVEFHDHRFPVDGSHAYGDRFGEARSGGRVHEGQDLPAGCGTPLIAARGGEVQDRGYSDALYGYWVLIDGTATEQDYFYAHLESPTPLGDGDRVHTGDRVGSVGKTGNARSEFCQLHFELWPDGYRNGSPRDPLPALRRWDDFS